MSEPPDPRPPVSQPEEKKPADPLKASAISPSTFRFLDCFCGRGGVSDGFASKEVPRITRRRIIAITGNFWFSLAPPYFHLWSQRVYVVKGISPHAKLVFLYDFKNQRLSG